MLLSSQFGVRFVLARNECTIYPNGFPMEPSISAEVHRRKRAANQSLSLDQMRALNILAMNHLLTVREHVELEKDPRRTLLKSSTNTFSEFYGPRIRISRYPDAFPFRATYTNTVAYPFIQRPFHHTL